MHQGFTVSNAISLWNNMLHKCSTRTIQQQIYLGYGLNYFLFFFYYGAGGWFAAPWIYSKGYIIYSYSKIDNRLAFLSYVIGCLVTGFQALKTNKSKELSYNKTPSIWLQNNGMIKICFLNSHFSCNWEHGVWVWYLWKHSGELYFY